MQACLSTGRPQHVPHGSNLQHNSSPQVHDETSSAAQMQRRHALRSHLSSRPDDCDTLRSLAELELGMGQGEHFVEFVRALCCRSPWAWRSVCSVLYESLGRRQDALSILFQVHQLTPNEPGVCCYLAELQPKEARHWYEQALCADPSFAPALIALADVHRQGDSLDEAVRLYGLAHQQAALSVRDMYHFGEVLVNSGKRSEGRAHLTQVLHSGTTQYHVNAALSLALSFAIDQHHEDALKHCTFVEDAHVGGPVQIVDEVKIAQAIKGVTLLRMGVLDESVALLRGLLAHPLESDAHRQHWDDLIHSFLIIAETLWGDIASAERHVSHVEKHAGGMDGIGFLVSAAYLKQVSGDLVAARNIFNHCVQSMPDYAPALMRIGYLSLCQRQFDGAVDLFQRCLDRSCASLAVGAAEVGIVHLHLCIAHHLRRTAPSSGSSPRALASSSPRPPSGRSAAGGGGASSARGAGASSSSSGLSPEGLDHCKRGLELRRDLQQALAALGPVKPADCAKAASRLVSGHPPRFRLMDLTAEQAEVLLLYSAALGPRPPQPASWQASPRGGAAVARSNSCSGAEGFAAVVRWPPSPSRASSSPSKRGAGGGLAGAASAVCALGKLPKSGASPTLVSTASTAAPLSTSPSREASCRALSDCPDPRVHQPPRQALAPTDFKLQECMSSGQFASVYRGLLISLGGQPLSEHRPVVVKTLGSRASQHDDDNVAAAADLLSEIAVLSGVMHPRIITFVGACLVHDNIALVTELAVGGNLHQAIHVRRRQFSHQERFRLSREMLQAIGYLHARQPPIAHLDVKSMNLLLDAGGEHLQLCDFGLARVLGRGGSGGAGCEGGAREEPPRAGRGSPRYMAPECHDSALGVITERADIWSAGCVLIEIFAGVLPYAECRNVQQILNIMLVHRRGPALPKTIEASVRGAMHCALAFEAKNRLPVAQVLVQIETVERFS